jgi:predicted DNA-binding protein
MVTLKEAAMNMPDEYVSVSTRLPKVDALLLQNKCKNQGTTTSEYIRNLIKKNIDAPQKNFLAGKNKIKYNKMNNTFSWIVQLDSGQETEVLGNLPQDFVKNLKDEIEKSITERNEWVHQTNDDSVSIPKKLVGGEKDGH